MRRSPGKGGDRSRGHAARSLPPRVRKACTRGSSHSRRSRFGSPPAIMVFVCRVQENGVVADGEDARQFMGDHDHGGAETVAKLSDQIVEQRGRHRVQSGRRFVEKQQFRIERQGPGHAGAFAHAAADFRRVVVLEPGETDERQLERHEVADVLARQIGVFAERQGDVLGEGHGTPEGALLIDDAELARRGPRVRCGSTSHRLTPSRNTWPLDGLLEAAEVTA